MRNMDDKNISCNFCFQCVKIVIRKTKILKIILEISILREIDGKKKNCRYII